MLSTPNLNYPFCVATDVSDSGIGGVLYQVIDDEIKYIAFAARSLSVSETGYSTTKRELLAVCYMLKKYHKWLWGNHFQLFTDHKALVYLHTQELPNPMMLGWFETILTIRFLSLIARISTI